MVGVERDRSVQVGREIVRAIRRYWREGETQAGYDQAETAEGSARQDAIKTVSILQQKVRTMTEIIQGSPEWFAARLGKVTASKISDLTAKTKTGWGASRANYMAQLVAERLTGTPGESFTNAAMQWGTEQEPFARESYCAKIGSEVGLVGFVDHPRISMSGASPDGLVGSIGLVEIKCPNTATHIETLLGQSVPGKYISQMQWQMACTGRQWCDFVSFDPRMPSHMQMFVSRVNRDNIAISELESMVVVFLDELAEKVSALTHLYAEDMA